MLTATSGRHPTGQHQLEVAPRQPVLPVQEKRPCQFQSHPHQLRMVDENELQGGDGPVVQLPARLVARRPVPASASAVMPMRNRAAARLLRSGGGASWACAAVVIRMHAKRAAMANIHRIGCWDIVIVRRRPWARG